MGHHYVPQKYLRGFCEPASDSMLWRYDKQTREFKRISVKAAAQEAGFYSEEDERKLEHLVEGPANGAIDKLRAGGSLDDADRAHLALYAATMLRRVPHSRELGKSVLPRALAGTVQEVKDFISQAAAQGLIDTSIAERRLAEADAAEARFTETTPTEVLERVRSPWPTQQMVQLVYNMTWRLIQTNAPFYFLTSDNPAFFFSGLGLASPDSEFNFPISSTLTLHGCWQPGPQNQLRILMKPAPEPEPEKREVSNQLKELSSTARADWPDKPSNCSLNDIFATPLIRLQKLLSHSKLWIAKQFLEVGVNSLQQRCNLLVKAGAVFVEQLINNRGSLR
jgi:hypothetical protein